LTKIIIRESSKWLGVRLTTLDYQHIAISIGREKVGEQFSHSYIEDTAEIEEPEVDEDDPLKVLAGRGGEVRAKRYGVSLDIVKHLSSRSIDTFRPLYQKWHAFLGLASYRGRGQKRTVRSDSSSSIYVAAQPQYPSSGSGGMVTTMANNGIRGWGTVVERLRAEGQVRSSQEGVSNGSWYFGREDSNRSRSE
jgi:hypothetical protein